MENLVQPTSNPERAKLKQFANNFGPNFAKLASEIGVIIAASRPANAVMQF